MDRIILIFFILMLKDDLLLCFSEFVRLYEAIMFFSDLFCNLSVNLLACLSYKNRVFMLQSSPKAFGPTAPSSLAFEASRFSYLAKERPAFIFNDKINLILSNSGIQSYIQYMPTPKIIKCLHFHATFQSSYQNFNNKTLQMKEHSLTFSFQYYLDLGNNKISHIFINQQSDPYVQASKFCAKENLSSILVTILGDSIKDQMDKEWNLILLHQKKTVKQGSRYQTEASVDLKPSMDTLHTELKDDGTHQISYQLHKVDKEPKQDSQYRVFEHLYNNYKEIQRKKELSRKKSFESIPFRPQINQLSEKIVLSKRKFQENNIPTEDRLLKPKKNRLMTISSSKSKISFAKLTESRENSKESLYIRSSIYQKKSQEKTRKLKDSIEKKLMQICSFKPRINHRIR